MENERLIKEGLRLLDDSLSRFSEVKNCEKSTIIMSIIHGLILIIEAVYQIKKK